MKQVKNHPPWELFLLKKREARLEGGAAGPGAAQDSARTLLPLLQVCGKAAGSSHSPRALESLIGVGLYFLNELFSLSLFKAIFHICSLFFNALFLAPPL